MIYKYTRNRISESTNTKFVIENTIRSIDGYVLEDDFLIKIDIIYSNKTGQSLGFGFDVVFTDYVSNYTTEEVKNFVIDVIGYIKQSELKLEIDYSTLENDLLEEVKKAFKSPKPASKLS